jgi:ELWxxDGT repeat protein
LIAGNKKALQNFNKTKMKHILIIVVCLLSFSAVALGVNAQVQVKDINPGGDSSSPYLFYPLNGKFLFSANDGVHKNQLYVSDGTNAGTIMLANSLHNP